MEQPHQTTLTAVHSTLDTNTVLPKDFLLAGLFSTKMENLTHILRAIEQENLIGIIIPLPPKERLNT
ncbi:hypothetical protein KL86DYS1_10254 [uncultured Dysgonomonas sp.]|uniref:Uncharacterized protein n=1 Tax=uncultured Dysgonomonas sp. TaxID=206096 RepID=A0A212IW33_9BACT|nr:hypothetical protein KL86DYS1_10254 [uncultured Dysgonomonas sp.]